MKTKQFLLLIVFSLTMLNSFGQKYSKSQFTVFSYFVSIDDKFKAELGKVEGQIKFKTDKKQISSQNI